MLRPISKPFTKMVDGAVWALFQDQCTARTLRQRTARTLRQRRLGGGGRVVRAAQRVPGPPRSRHSADGTHMGRRREPSASAGWGCKGGGGGGGEVHPSKDSSPSRRPHVLALLNELD